MSISSAKLQNIACTNADQEYPVTVERPSFMRLQARANDIRVAFQSGFVATSSPPFITIKAGQPPREFHGLRGADVRLYIAATVAGAVLEVEGWA